MKPPTPKPPSAEQRARRMVRVESQGLGWWDIRIGGHHFGTWYGRGMAVSKAKPLRTYIATNIEAAVGSAVAAERRRKKGRK